MLGSTGIISVDSIMRNKLLMQGKPPAPYLALHPPMPPQINICPTARRLLPTQTSTRIHNKAQATSELASSGPSLRHLHSARSRLIRRQQHRRARPPAMRLGHLRMALILIFRRVDHCMLILAIWCKRGVRRRVSWGGWRGHDDLVPVLVWMFSVRLFLLSYGRPISPCITEINF